MSRAARVPAVLVAAALSCAAGSAPASAAYDNGFDGVPGAFLVSADYARLEQGDDTTRYAAISADGRYVAIETFARNFFDDDDPDPPGEYRAGGIFRFDLQTRALAKVADGNLFSEADNSFLRRGASNPSISADGRYVAFSTAQRLVPGDEDANVDVYRRDMDVALPVGGVCTAETPPPCPYRLASARDGSEAAAAFAPPGQPTTGGDPGAEATRGSAISADGNRVVFRTEAASDLPAGGDLETPAGQVFVRNLKAQTTTLVSAIRDPETGLMTQQPAGGSIGAAISGDGTTVVWTGAHAPSQTRFLNGENTDPTFNYYLWRRVSAGPAAPLAPGPEDQTRRITGLADPDDPACSPQATTVFDGTSTGPCYGPLTNQEANLADIGSQVPALSRDGYTVAFVTGAGPRPLPFTGTAFDLWVTKMNPGLSRKQASTELTRDTAVPDPSISAPISSVAISADGRYLAVTSSRTQFTLPALTFVGEPRAVVGPAELYLIDRQEETIERTLHSTAGGDIGGSVIDGPTISADGSRIGFAAFAGNLFYGDANQRADAFVATREPEPQPEGGQGAPAEGDSSVETLGGPHLGARLLSVRGGVATLSVSVPAAGKLSGAAQTIGGRRPQEVADGRAAAKRRSRVRLQLRVPSGKRATLRAGGPLPTRAKLSFVPTGGGRHLRTSLRVVFFSRSSPDRHK